MQTRLVDRDAYKTYWRAFAGAKALHAGQVPKADIPIVFSCVVGTLQELVQREARAIERHRPTGRLPALLALVVFSIILNPQAVNVEWTAPDVTAFLTDPSWHTGSHWVTSSIREEALAKTEDVPPWWRVFGVAPANLLSQATNFRQNIATFALQTPFRELFPYLTSASIPTPTSGLLGHVAALVTVWHYAAVVRLSEEEHNHDMLAPATAQTITTPTSAPDSIDITAPKPGHGKRRAVQDADAPPAKRVRNSTFQSSHEIVDTRESKVANTIPAVAAAGPAKQHMMPLVFLPPGISHSSWLHSFANITDPRHLEQLFSGTVRRDGRKHQDEVVLVLSCILQELLQNGPRPELMPIIQTMREVAESTLSDSYTRGHSRLFQLPSATSKDSGVPSEDCDVSMEEATGGAA